MNHMTKLVLLGFLFTFLCLEGCGKSDNQDSLIGGGSEVGNGGNAVVCRDEDKKITSVRLLDFYEAEVLKDIRYYLGDKSLSAGDKLAIAFNRLKKVDSERAEKYQRKADEFLENTRFLSGVKLSDTNDYGYIKIPSFCSIEQLCIQKRPTSPNEKLYSINLDLWDRLDEDHRAGMMLHEIVYRDALDHNHKDSIRARQFTGILASLKFEEMSQTQYEELMKRLSLNNSGPTPVVNVPHWKANPIVLPSAQTEMPFSFDLSSLVENPSSLPMTFSLMSGPAWLRVNANGIIGGTPSSTDVGVATFTFQFSTFVAGKAYEESSLAKLQVTFTAKPPIAKMNPIRLPDVTANQLMMASITEFVVDPAGSPLTFSLMSGPSWASLSAAGKLSGSPRLSNVGENRWEIRATNAQNLFVDITVILVVLKPSE